MDTNKLILVTGGAGYVGAMLVRKLLESGFCVRVIDSFFFGDRGLRGIEGHSRLEVIVGDIRDIDIVTKSIKNVDTVIHLAGISNDVRSEVEIKMSEQINFDATKSLIEISKESGVNRFVYASSCSVYGYRDDMTVTELSAVQPLNIYGKTKVQSEEVVLENAGENFTCVILRPATVCGFSPRMRLDLVINTLTYKAIVDNKIEIFGRNQTRSNVHIKDLTNCYVSLLETPREKINGQIFNIGYENNTILELAKIVMKTVGEEVELVTRDTVDNRSYRVSSEKIEHQLGFVPVYSVEDAVIDISAAYRNGLIPNPDNSIYRNVRHLRENRIV